MEATYPKPGELVVRLPRGDGKADEVGGRFFDKGMDARIQAIVASGGALTLRLATGEDGDTLGHQAPGNTVVVIAGGDEDVEGHALALRFPSVKDAQEFQRRLLLTGVIAGALVVGVVGVNVADSNQATGAGAVGGATTIVQPRGATDDIGLMDASGAAISGAAQAAQPRGATDDVGLMDASGAAISGAAQAAQPRGATDDIGLMDASGAAISGAAQSTSRPADDDVGLMDPTGAAVQDDEARPPQFRGR